MFSWGPIQPPIKKNAFPAKSFFFFKMPTLPCISTSTQPLAATRSHSQPLAATRSHSQPLAATRSHSQPCLSFVAFFLSFHLLPFIRYFLPFVSPLALHSLWHFMRYRLHVVSPLASTFPAKPIFSRWPFYLLFLPARSHLQPLAATRSHSL